MAERILPNGGRALTEEIECECEEGCGKTLTIPKGMEVTITSKQYIRLIRNGRCPHGNEDRIVRPQVFQTHPYEAILICERRNGH